ncbi:MAG: hypothetical protein LBP29_01580 [Treponema sp.]|jgi:hypothetical protein|nr:hypothetical protein [Treponema sp.]
MKKKIHILAVILLFAAAGTVSADFDDDVIALFNDFLGRLTAKHETLKNLAMPGTEVRGIPGEESLTQAVILLRFESLQDTDVFVAALEAENIPYGSFPDDDRKILLFSEDMIRFVMKDAIGL